MATTSAPVPGGSHVQAGTRQAYIFATSRFTLLINSEESGGTSCTMEVISPPGDGANPHTHADADEQFYVLNGDVTFRVGEETYHASPGDVIFIPRGTVHSFKAGAAPAKMLATFTPGGIENFFRAMGTPIHD